jgi:hypothetical protein
LSPITNHFTPEYNQGKIKFVVSTVDLLDLAGMEINSVGFE